MSDLRCKCSMSISLTGDGCRYCQPQEYIDRLSEWLAEARQERDEAQAKLQAVAGQEPVAWMHKNPKRYDVISAKVKDLLQQAAGHMHRPLDKSEHYTTPLYEGPQPGAIDREKLIADFNEKSEADLWEQAAINARRETMGNVEGGE